MLGWTVLNNLKLDPATRHIPVQMLSVEEERQHGLSHGAFSYLVKPATTEDLETGASIGSRAYVAPHTKRLLVVEDNDIERAEHRRAAGARRHRDRAGAAPAPKRWRRCASSAFDCCVLDLRLPDMTGFELLERMQGEPPLRDVPVVVFTGKELSSRRGERGCKWWPRASSSRTCSRRSGCSTRPRCSCTASSPTCRTAKQQMLERLHGSNEVLRGRKVLVVDDDARNIFALTTVLENHEMDVISATNGRQAIELIQSTPDLSVVLMDIMMPEMDGYETMREIRKQPQFRTLPILALTAKAMKGDREKCLEAGASRLHRQAGEHRQLLSLLRVWLYR